MIKNYFKIALRNLVKQKSLAFINVFGLSIGITCFTLCVLYSINEFSFDSFHHQASNIYLVRNSSEKANSNQTDQFIFTPMPLGPAMKHDLPGVEDYVRYIQPYETFIKINNTGGREDISYADRSFFHVFSYRFKYGNAATALKDLHSIVLTEGIAVRLFGKANAVGESIQIKVENSFEPFIISAIVENPPSNSSIQFSMIASFDRFANTAEGKMSAGVWGWNAYVTFVRLTPGNRLATNSKLLSDFRNSHFPKGFGSEGGYTLEPVLNIHTNPRLTGLKVAPIDSKTIWILLSIATGVLLISCINFTTLSIGRSASRSKEVGVRKVIGGTKNALILQFLTESLLLAFLSALLGLLLAVLLLPYFNQLSGRELSLSLGQVPQLLAFIIGLVLIVGLLSGCYPALILSGFSAVEVLKTKIKLGGANLFTRSLVTLQFVLSATLIISAIIIVQQLHFMQSRNPGFEKANVLDVETLGISGTTHLYPLFKHELSLRPEIAGVASADNGLGEHEGMNTTGFTYRQKLITIAQYYIDPDYLPTLGMHLLVGRNFNREIASDTVNAVIINETTMNEIGWTVDNVVGQPLEGYGNYGVKNPIVIGVVRDFNYQALTNPVQPLMFHQFSASLSQPNHFFVRIQPGDPSRALVAINTIWKKIAPEYPLKYNFLDEDLDRFYKSEERLSNIISWTGGIAIFLACLGLFGLASLAVVNRTREIGIRKVLGASVSTLFALISKDFVRLVTIAFLIAVPTAWLLMTKWLQEYVYRINIEWWVFCIAGMAIIFIALLTVCFHAIRAAMANPVKSLRTE